jgi:hypothetical protein
MMQTKWNKKERFAGSFFLLFFLRFGQVMKMQSVAKNFRTFQTKNSLDPLVARIFALGD